jgi:sigma-B regulation protein RsbU (phosphoserine phosphatase)
MISEMGTIFVRLVSSLSVFIVIAGLIGGSDIVSSIVTSKSKRLHAFLIGVAGGAFGVYGNLSGIDVNGAIVTIRDIGPMLAGFLAGPLAGVVAGLIAGIHRYTMGGITAEACVVATGLIGILCGWLSRDLQGRIFTPIWAFTVGVLMEGTHLIIVMLMVKPQETAEEICRQIALPFIFINATGFMMLIFLIKYIWNQRNLAEERTRLRSELQAASVIQHSLLPTVTDRNPGCEELDLRASMKAAKEVGGDFYDFFFTDDTHLALVIADVSGKGIPAALFMANAKQTIQSYVRDYHDLSKAVYAANNSLCQNNDAEMFVTAWIGIINLDTGRLRYVNAGHNHPVLITDMPSYIRDRSGVVLAAMEGMPYTESVLEMNIGDKILLYTDGITEAENSSHELFGEDRLLECLMKSSGDSVEETMRKVDRGVAGFVKEHDQFDDMTMMCIEYRGTDNTKEKE